MRSFANLWPLTSIKFFLSLIGGALLLCLFPACSLAQDQDENADPPTTNGEISSTSKSSEAPLYESRDMRDKSLLAKALDDEAQWLDTEHGKILALYRPTEAKTTRGALILFHAAENPQFWPPMLEDLRANLPRYGWETLAITLPQKYPAEIPARPSSPASASSSSPDAQAAEGGTAPEEATGITESSTASAASSSASSSVARALLIETYTDAAINFLKEKGQFNVVVLTDNSSAYQILGKLIPQIQENSRDSTTVDGPLQALVITNLQQQEPITKTELEAIFAAKQLPALDIFFAPDNKKQIASRDLHRAVAMRKKIAIYQQLLMGSQPKIVERDHQGYLLGRVRGFMQQNAGGTEIKTEENPKKDD
jgi:hypothetical protein